MLGVELLDKLECTDDYLCLSLHCLANFRHYEMALFTLYHVCTRINWSEIMKDTLKECWSDTAQSFEENVAIVCFCKSRVTFVRFVSIICTFLKRRSDYMYIS